MLLSLLVAATFLLAGCTSDGTEGDGDGTPEGELLVAKGASLGEWTHSAEGGPLVGGMEPTSGTCTGGPEDDGAINFSIPAADDDGVPWKASTLTITIAKAQDEGATELVFFLLDADGDELGANTENDLMGTNPYVLTVNNVGPGDYTLNVVACTPVAPYTLSFVGAMVASQDVYSSE